MSVEGPQATASPLHRDVRLSFWVRSMERCRVSAFRIPVNYAVMRFIVEGP